MVLGVPAKFDSAVNGGMGIDNVDVGRACERSESASVAGRLTVVTGPDGSGVDSWVLNDILGLRAGDLAVEGVGRMGRALPGPITVGWLRDARDLQAASHLAESGKFVVGLMVTGSQAAVRQRWDHWEHVSGRDGLAARAWQLVGTIIVTSASGEPVVVDVGIGRGDITVPNDLPDVARPICA